MGLGHWVRRCHFDLVVDFLLPFIFGQGAVDSGKGGGAG